MNCKIGDLAIIILGSGIAGRIVEVVDTCPKNVEFRLPDGCRHYPVNHDWIVKFQNPVEAPCSNGSIRTTVWAPCPDRVLRPISGLPLYDEMSEDVKEPA
jgi:hypothetical protein